MLSNFYELFQVELGYIELQGGDTTLALPANASVAFCCVELNNDATCSWSFNTVTNGATLSGQAIRLASNCHSGNVAVNGGSANGIPGNGGIGLYDETCSLTPGGQSTKGGHFFWNKFGDAVAGDIAALTYSIYKNNTLGQCYIAVNDNGVIKETPIGRNVNTQTGTTYTTTTSDRDGRIEMNNAAANTLTVDTNSNMPVPVGTEIRVVQVGTGATTIVAASGVTGDNFGAIGRQWKSVLLYKRGVNEWVQTNV
jgi:hypothetical protein